MTNLWEGFSSSSSLVWANGIQGWFSVWKLIWNCTFFHCLCTGVMRNSLAVLVYFSKLIYFFPHFFIYTFFFLYIYSMQEKLVRWTCIFFPNSFFFSLHFCVSLLLLHLSNGNSHKAGLVKMKEFRFEGKTKIVY